MKQKQTESLLKALILFSYILIILGAFLKIYHFANGNLVLTIGFLSGIILSSFEINRLKKIVKENKDKVTEKTGL
jgi:uncharacterized membrane protein